MSDQIDDGGPAFPLWTGNLDNSYSGMSLRDYFAAKAMKSMAQALSANEISEMADGVLGGARISKAAGVLADAMLAERKSCSTKDTMEH